MDSSFLIFIIAVRILNVYVNISKYKYKVVKQRLNKNKGQMMGYLGSVL